MRELYLIFGVPSNSIVVKEGVIEKKSIRSITWEARQPFVDVERNPVSRTKHCLWYSIEEESFV